MLDEGDVDQVTKLVLVNAIYFKSKWMMTFKSVDTREAQFKLNKVNSCHISLKYIFCKKILSYINVGLMFAQHIVILIPTSVAKKYKHQSNDTTNKSKA